MATTSIISHTMNPQALLQSMLQQLRGTPTTIHLLLAALVLGLLLKTVAAAWLTSAICYVSDMTVLWQCYDACCLGVILAIVYHQCPDSTHFTSFAMLHYEHICTKARHATEQVLSAFDEHVATSRCSCNPVCQATELFFCNPLPYIANDPQLSANPPNRPRRS